MKVRCKMVCQSKEEQNHGNGNTGFTVVFLPVTGGSEENEQFYKYTPGGRVEMATVNPSAAKAFKVGGEYYLDFTPVEQDG